MYYIYIYKYIRTYTICIVNTKTRSFTIKFEVKAVIATVLRKGRPAEKIHKTQK